MTLEVDGNGISPSNYMLTKIDEPSPPISGSYKLNLNGSPL